MKRHHIITIGFAALALLTGCAPKAGQPAIQVEQPQAFSGVVTVSGVELPYFIEGEGIPCIIAGDAFVTSRALSKELRKHFKFIITDFRGDIPEDQVGDASNITLGTLIDDIEEVRKALGFQEVCVLGHSIWGLVALEYARKYPEYTSHVIMNGTPPGWSSSIRNAGNEYWNSHASDERKLILKQNWEKLPEDTLSRMSPSEAFVLAYITNTPKYWYDPTYDDFSLVGEGAYYMNVEVFDQVLSVIFADHDIAKGDPIATPVFLSLGRHDYVVPYYLWDDQKDKITDLSYNLFEKSGHWAMLEEQALFDSLLIDWIKGQ